MPDEPITDSEPRALGAIIRAFDEKEMKYRLKIPAAVDITRNRSLLAHRSPVRDQGGIGSCVANATTVAAEMLARIAGRPNVADLNRGWLYAKTRMKEGSFPQDAGSVDADAFDILMSGAPRQDLWPYVDNAALTPPAELDSDAPHQDYVLAQHQPFYASDPGGFQAGICTALDLLMPVAIAMAWYADFDNPPNGELPVRQPGAGLRGYHEVLVLAYQYLGGRRWRAICVNSWGTGYPARPLTNFEASGDGLFAIPGELFENGIINGCRAASAEPYTPPQPDPPNPPPPPPDPTPDPPTPPVDRYTEGLIDGWNRRGDRACADLTTYKQMYGQVSAPLKRTTNNFIKWNYAVSVEQQAIDAIQAETLDTQTGETFTGIPLKKLS